MTAEHQSVPDVTRFVHLVRPRDVTEYASNDVTTGVAPWQLHLLEALASSPDLAFGRALPRLTEAARRLDGEGVVYAATYLDEVVAWGAVRARRDQPNVAVIGRHSEADMALGDDPTLSLRHVAVVVHPWRCGGRRTLRLVDLRSGLGALSDIAGRVHAIEADDFLHLASGGFRFFALATQPGGGDLPSAEELAESLTTIDVLSPPRVPDAADTSPVVGHLHVGPTASAGRFDPTSPRHTVAVTAAEVREGFTLGRYSRASLAISDALLSRLHALITDIDDRLWIFDTASRNGLFVNRQRARVAELRPRGPTFIDAGSSELVWIPATF